MFRISRAIHGGADFDILLRSSKALHSPFHVSSSLSPRSSQGMSARDGSKASALGGCWMELRSEERSK